MWDPSIYLMYYAYTSNVRHTNWMSKFSLNQNVHLSASFLLPINDGVSVFNFLVWMHWMLPSRWLLLQWICQTRTKIRINVPWRHQTENSTSVTLETLKRRRVRREWKWRIKKWSGIFSIAVGNFSFPSFSDNVQIM